MSNIIFTNSTNITSLDCYSLIKNGSKNQILHSFGTLYRLLNNPELFNPSLFAIVIENDEPYCLVSITKNNQREGMCDARPSFPLSNHISFQYPNFEIMAYTNVGRRGKGLATEAIKNLLLIARVKQNDTIYLYSRRMKRIVQKIGFYNVTNLHEFSA